jgi:hypothetical protein
LGSPYDLKNKDWLITYVKGLEDLGLEKEGIKDILRQIKAAYRFLDQDKDLRGSK